MFANLDLDKVSVPTFSIFVFRELKNSKRLSGKRYLQ